MYNYLLNTGKDLLPGLSTFAVCLFYRLEVGIAVGVLIQISSLLYTVARPRLQVEEITVSYKHLIIDSYNMYVIGSCVWYLPYDDPSPEYSIHLSLLYQGMC